MSGDFSLVEQYQISNPSSGGAILTFSSAITGQYVTLETDRKDNSQLWTLWASVMTSGYRVENYKFNTAYVARLPGDTSLLGSSEEQTHDWYMFPTGVATYYRICQDAGCTFTWAPYSRIGGASSSNQVGVIAPTDAEYETWRIIAVGSSSTPGGGGGGSAEPPPMVTSTTAGFSVIPEGSSTAPSIPVPTESSGLSKQNLDVVKTCCGGKKCEFTPSGDATSETYQVLIGQPVRNCDPASKENTLTKFGGSFELQHSFSYEVTSTGGMGFAGPSIGITTSVGEQRTTKTTQSQEVEVAIPPGQMGALIAQVKYSTQPGRMSVDKRTQAFVSIQPENVLAIDVVYASCQSNFEALSLPRAPDCLKSSGMGRGQMRWGGLRYLSSLTGLLASFWVLV